MEYIAVQCAGCATFNSVQRRKDAKWSCRLCSLKQSVVRVFASSGRAADVRTFIQAANLARGQREQERARVAAERYDDGDGDGGGGYDGGGDDDQQQQLLPAAATTTNSIWQDWADELGAASADVQALQQQQQQHAPAASDDGRFVTSSDGIGRYGPRKRKREGGEIGDGGAVVAAGVAAPAASALPPSNGLYRAPAAPVAQRGGSPHNRWSSWPAAASTSSSSSTGGASAAAHHSASSLDAAYLRGPPPPLPPMAASSQSRSSDGGGGGGGAQHPFRVGAPAVPTTDASTSALRPPAAAPSAVAPGMHAAAPVSRIPLPVPRPAVAQATAAAAGDTAAAIAANAARAAAARAALAALNPNRPPDWAEHTASAGGAKAAAAAVTATPLPPSSSSWVHHGAVYDAAAGAPKALDFGAPAIDGSSPGAGGRSLQVAASPGAGALPSRWGAPTAAAGGAVPGSGSRGGVGLMQPRALHAGPAGGTGGGSLLATLGRRPSGGDGSAPPGASQFLLAPGAAPSPQQAQAPAPRTNTGGGGSVWDDYL
jgi:hypothetical protein